MLKRLIADVHQHRMRLDFEPLPEHLERSTLRPYRLVRISVANCNCEMSNQIRPHAALTFHAGYA